MNRLLGTHEDDKKARQATAMVDTKYHLSPKSISVMTERLQVGQEKHKRETWKELYRTSGTQLSVGHCNLSASMCRAFYKALSTKAELGGVAD